MATKTAVRPITATELEMVLDAREYLLANGGTPAELERNQRLIDKYRAEKGSAFAAGNVMRVGGGDGNGARRPARPAVPPKLLAYAASLLRDLWSSDQETGEELVEGLAEFDADHLSVMIDNLKTLIPITEGQVRFAHSLFAQKFGTTGAREFAASLDGMTKVEAKTMLDTMQTLPDYVAPAPAAGEAPVAGERPRRGGAPEVKADGMYRDPATGDIYKVQIAHHGSGNLYAKKLVKLDEPKLVRGKEAHFEFVMARGAIYNIKPEWALDRADAKEFGDLYGCCMRCGLVLTDEASIDAGLGSTCIKKM